MTLQMLLLPSLENMGESGLRITKAANYVAMSIALCRSHAARSEAAK
jgi:hypothetical protein